MQTSVNCKQNTKKYFQKCVLKLSGHQKGDMLLSESMMAYLGIYIANVLEILQSCTKPSIGILLPQYDNHDILINWYYTFCVFFAGFCLAV